MTDTRLEGKDSAVMMRALGRTGKQVSPYCLGTMMFGRAGGLDR